MASKFLQSLHNSITRDDRDSPAPGVLRRQQSCDGKAFSRPETAGEFKEAVFRLVLTKLTASKLPFLGLDDYVIISYSSHLFDYTFSIKLINTH